MYMISVISSCSCTWREKRKLFAWKNQCSQKNFTMQNINISVLWLALWNIMTRLSMMITLIGALSDCVCVFRGRYLRIAPWKNNTMYCHKVTLTVGCGGQGGQENQTVWYRISCATLMVRHHKNLLSRPRTKCTCMC